MPKRTRDPLRPEVREAVNDILDGMSVDTHTEWLQREYVRLMRREAKMRQAMLESKSASVAQQAVDGGVVEGGSAEQHRSEEHGAGPDGDAANEH